MSNSVNRCSDHCYVQHKEGSLYPQGLCIIPNEILFIIFSFATVKVLPAISLTCKSWKSVTDEDNFWQLYSQRSICFFKEHKWMKGKTWKENFKILQGGFFSNSLQGTSLSLPADPFAIKDEGVKRLYDNFKDIVRVRDGVMACLSHASRLWGHEYYTLRLINLLKKEEIDKTIPKLPTSGEPYAWDSQGNIVIMCFYHPVLIMYNFSTNKEVKYPFSCNEGDSAFAISIVGDTVTIGCGDSSSEKISSIQQFRLQNQNVQT